MRDICLDRAKGFAIILVVLGHLAENFMDNTHDLLGVFHYYIYCFHMPFFFVLSGMSYRASQLKRGGG